MRSGRVALMNKFGVGTLSLHNEYSSPTFPSAGCARIISASLQSAKDGIDTCIAVVLR